MAHAHDGHQSVCEECVWSNARLNIPIDWLMNSILLGFWLQELEQGGHA